MFERFDTEIFTALKEEEEKQAATITLIPSENIVSRNVLEATGSLMTNKYAEGYPGKRYYGGCRHVDTVEKIALERACRIFKAEHANVQPHSGSQANMAVYLASIKPGDKILAMDLGAGGHLTHGLSANFSGIFYRPAFYSVNRENEQIDYGEVRKIAHRERPDIIVCGASAYSRTIDFERFSEIAKETNSLLLADIAHIAGLVAADLHPSPVPHSDFVTATTHKTMRGPRGGLVLCRKNYSKKLNSAVMPGIQGGPLMHVIAAKAVSFKEVLEPEFLSYQQQIIKNSATLCSELKERGYRIVSGGTDNHMFVVDLRNRGINGNDAQELLENSGIITNKNLVPYDPLPPNVTSGIRVGSPSITSRGMKEKEMIFIAESIDAILKNKDNNKILKEIALKVRRFSLEYPIYPKT